MKNFLFFSLFIDEICDLAYNLFGLIIRLICSFGVVFLLLFGSNEQTNKQNLENEKTEAEEENQKTKQNWTI